LHPQKQISYENHNPTQKGRTLENKLIGKASKKNSETKKPYQAQGATLRRTRHIKQQNQDILCVCVCVSEKTRHTSKKFQIQQHKNKTPKKPKCKKAQKS